MDDRTGHGGRGGSGQALRRVVGAAGGAELLGSLADRLPGADLTTLLLEVFRRRAEDAMLGALPDGFDTVVLAPVLPLGAHTAAGGVDPRNVIATIRGTEVAADPTNGLALEAAVRRDRLLRQSPRSADPVRLAASQRVTRAQLFDGPVSFAHFQLLGVVTAGRDTGNHEFERRHLAEHVAAAAAGLASLGIQHVAVAITCLDEAARLVFADVANDLARLAGTEVVEAPEPES